VDWISEVTDCSKTCWVVVHLYQDSIPHCNLVEEAFLELAPRFRSVKFIKIRSTQAVENWPDRNLPTIFCYNEGELKQQMLTAKALGGDAMRTDDLEWWLAQNEIIESELEENPASTNRSKRAVFGKHTTLTASTFDDEDDEEVW
jgi:Phosducin